ncbi:class I adenylate-forming enzyme family protein [Deinococcus multiflagellatus]|uniref:class I adenylate-forming enzyme family protein n=1 Tax=Deinococcus multiflagellatus TaxID=1656887 RepID=UPI001CCE6A44|nr:class I adenylate-forming enzyme family protein [Deinococcus multiflagellatus]MBZ9712996.1 acyl--CoA ligase [Deinococcus multiflagellatus]
MRAAWRAVTATGVLAPSSPRALLGLAAAVLRHGPTLYALVAWHARRTPHRVALTDADGPATWAQLQARADEVAARLGPFTRPGDWAALCSEGGRPFVAGLLGALRVGARVLLLPPGPPDEVARRLAGHPIRALLTDDPRLDALNLPTVALTAGAPGSQPQPGAPRPGWPRAGRPVLLTSGTTGEPRVVTRRVSPRAASRVGLRLLQALRPARERAALLPLPLWHGHGLSTLALALALGTPLHLRRGARAAELWAVLAQEQVGTLVVVPTLLRRLLQETGHAPALHTVICGSAPLDPALAVQTQARLGDVLFNLYGSTETGLIALATPDDLRAEPGSVGHPLPGVQVRTAPDGQLQVRGLLSRGWLNTGDLGTLDPAGRVHLRGRADDLMIVGGENVWPAQLEAVLGAQPGVRACAVFGVPCAEYGQAPLAFVELAPEGGGAATLHQRLAEVLPRRLRPRLTVLPALPRTETGKVARAELRARLSEASLLVAR